MNRLARASAVYASLSFVAAVVIGGVYYFYYRTMLPTQQRQAAIERFLKDPASPIEQVRKVAIDSHEVVIAGFRALDAAIMVIVILCVIAGVGFLSLARALRKAKGESAGAF